MLNVDGSNDYFFIQYIVGPGNVKIHAQRYMLTPSPIIDGALNDEVWQKDNWCSGFTQHEPHNGAEPSQQTEFMITYDNDYLYAAFRLHDTEPDKIVARVTRRDDIVGDFVAIGIDS